MMGNGFGERLRVARTEAGKTQEAVAQESGLSIASIQKYEAGLAQPRLSNIAAIAKAVDKPLSYFQREYSPTSKEVSPSSDILAQLLAAKDREIELLSQRVHDIHQDFTHLIDFITPHLAFLHRSAEETDIVPTSEEEWYWLTIGDDFLWRVDNIERKLEDISRLEDRQRKLHDEANSRRSPERKSATGSPPPEKAQIADAIETDPNVIRAWEAWKDAVNQPSIQLNTQTRNHLRYLLSRYHISAVIKGMTAWSSGWFVYNEDGNPTQDSAWDVWHALPRIIESEGRLGPEPGPPEEFFYKSATDGGFPPNDENLDIDEIPF